MTLTGVFFMVVPFLFVLAANPDGKSEDVPPIYLFSMALGMFIFQTLDNMDGRQARRTKSSNALGEFFDHGCDTISDACMTLSFVSSLRIGTNLEMFFLMGLISPFPDYCFFWRAHWTGKYVFGDMDISEIQWIIMTVLCLSGITDKTGAIWTDVSLYGYLNLKQIFIGAYFAFLCFYLGDVWWDAVKIGLFNAKTDKEISQEARNNVLAPTKPLMIMMSMAVASRYLSGGIFELYPVGFFVVYSLVVSKLSCRLLIANMTKSKMATFDSSMFSFLFLFLSNDYFKGSCFYLAPGSALFVAGCFAMFDFCKYAINICTQLADFLGVYCLTLKKSPAGKENGLKTN